MRGYSKSCDPLMKSVPEEGTGSEIVGGQHGKAKVLKCYIHLVDKAEKGLERIDSNFEEVLQEPNELRVSYSQKLASPDG